MVKNLILFTVLVPQIFIASYGFVLEPRVLFLTQSIKQVFQVYGSILLMD